MDPFGGNWPAACQEYLQFVYAHGSGYDGQMWNGDWAGFTDALSACSNSSTPSQASGGMTRGSGKFAQAQQALSSLLGDFYQEFMAGLGTDCENDLAAVGISDSAVATASLKTNILDGLTTVSNYAFDVYGNSPLYAAAAAQYGSEMMVQYMSLNPNTAAVSQLSGNNIYINASWVNGMNTPQQEGLLLHEMIHNITGLTDGDIQSKLGLPTNAASQNIGDKLQKDCF
jgi:hypothetical protein